MPSFFDRQKSYNIGEDYSKVKSKYQQTKIIKQLPEEEEFTTPKKKSDTITHYKGSKQSSDRYRLQSAQMFGDIPESTISKSSSLFKQSKNYSPRTKENAKFLSLIVEQNGEQCSDFLKQENITPIRLRGNYYVSANDYMQ